MSSKIFVLLVSAGLLTGCSHRKSNIDRQTGKNTKNTIHVDSDLQSRLKAFCEKPRVKGRFAFCVYDLTADKTVFQYNPTEKLPIASCLKLVTGIAAQHMLTHNFQYETRLYSKGRIRDGIYRGILTLKGSLDPQLDGTDFNILTKKLKSYGVTKINGKVVMDLILTEPVKSEKHWFPWDLNFSKYGVFYKGKECIKNEFKASLRNQGISVADSSFSIAHLPEGSACMLRYRRPMSAVVLRMWKNSSNTQSTGLLYTIGHRYMPDVDPAGAGVVYLKKFMMEEIGCKPADFIIHDGCGLCPYNQMTAPALVRVLRYGYKNADIFNRLSRMLPLSGVDGTLHREMAGPKTRGKIRAKTGTLSHPVGISSLAGFCKGGNGHQLCFSILNSEMSVLDARVIQHKICEELVERKK